MVEQCGVSGTYLGLGTHTLLSAAGGIVAAVGQQFVAIDAQELALGELFLALEFLAESTCQRVALHLPQKEPHSPLNEEGSRKTASFFFVDNQAFRLVGILVYKGLNLVLGSLSPLDKNPIGNTCDNV